MSKISDDFKREYLESLEVNKYDNLDSIYKEAYEIFIDAHYSDDLESLLCQIHNSFPSGHNCVGCNLNDSNLRIEKFLIQHDNFQDLYLTFTTFIFLLYLQVESIYEYFDIIQLQESYKQKHFQSFQTVKRWANFLKHPKAFMLVHHPKWTFEGRKINDVVEKISKTTPLINSNFVNEYYSGDRKNKELFKKLNKKEDILVVFPNPVELIKDFTIAQIKFTDIIANNEIVRDLLDNKATIENHFIEENPEI